MEGKYVMTAGELKEVEAIRSWCESGHVDDPGSLDSNDGLLLLKALDAALARAERAEALYSLEKESSERLTLMAESAERARKEAAEALIEVMKERDEVLALVDARGRALEGCIKALENGRYRREEKQGALDALTVAWEALSLPAPEALRQQQEREAGLAAQIEELRRALEIIAGHTEDENAIAVATKILAITAPEALETAREAERKMNQDLITAAEVIEEKDAQIEALTKLITDAFCISRDDLSFRDRQSKARLKVFLDKGELPDGVTPPQALAQQRERMEKALKVVEAARTGMEGMWRNGGSDSETFVFWMTPLDDALAEFDAERGCE